MKRILHILIVMTLVFSVGVTVYADEVSDAMDAVDKAEASLLQADVTDAEALVALVPESETKNVLTSRLNAVQSIITNQVAPAEAAVLQAETTLLQADVTSAQPPVDSLPLSAAKTALLARLSAVQDIINATATAAVATAETSLLQADVNTAQPLVTALTDGTVKTGLQTRLDVVQDLVDAKALKDTIEAAAPGATVIVSKDINYNQSELGSILINKAVTLDCNEFKIKVDQNLFQIISSGALTLVKAQIESEFDLIEDNRGSLTVQSTYGSGINAENDFVENNYGSVIVKDGKFKTGDEFVSDNHSSGNVVIWNGTFDIGYEFVDNNYGTCTIHDGIFNVYDEIVDDNYGTFTIHNGEFNHENDLVEDNYGNFMIYNGTFNIDDEFLEDNYGIFTIHNGTFNTGDYFINSNDNIFTIHNGTFNIGSDFVDEIAGTLIIKNGIFTAGNRIVATTRDGSEIFIHGGVFSGNTEEIDNGNNGENGENPEIVNLLNLSGIHRTILSGGKFTNQNGYPVFGVEEPAQLIIKDGHYAVPKETWLESSVVEVLAYKTETVEDADEDADTKKAADTEKTAGTEKTVDGISPKTGDNANLYLLFILLIGSALILISLMIYEREIKEK